MPSESNGCAAYVALALAAIAAIMSAPGVAGEASQLLESLLSDTTVIADAIGENPRLITLPDDRASTPPDVKLALRLAQPQGRLSSLPGSPLSDKPPLPAKIGGGR
jgi:hypothetical protein